MIIATLYIGAVGNALALGLVVWVAYPRAQRALHNLLTRCFPGLSVTQSHTFKRQLLGIGALTFAFLLCMSGSLLLAATVSVIFAPAIPAFMIWRADSSRRMALEQALIVGLNSTANSLRAGLSLKESLALSAANAPAAYSNEIQRTLRDYNLGMSLGHALEQMRDRVASENAQAAISAMIIGYEQGGNLASILQRTVATIQDRIRVSNKLRSLTAQGRTQAFILGAAPPFVAIGMYWWDSDKFGLLLHTTFGQVLLAAAVILELTGLYITYRILQLDI